MDFPPNYRFSVNYGGKTYVDVSQAAAEAAGVPDTALFAGFLADLQTLVDQAAETVRDAFVTKGSGQAMEYQEVQAEARAALASPSTATPALYPMLAASIGIDIDPSTNAPALDVLGVSRAAMASYTAWSVAGAAVRKARLTGKAAIAAATTCAAASAAYMAIAWPTAASIAAAAAAASNTTSSAATQPASSGSPSTAAAPSS